MQSLNENQKAFVYAWLNLGARRGKQAEAAMLAGYCPDNHRSAAATACRLMRTPEVIEAIQEETKKRLSSSVAMAADFIENTLDDPTVATKDKLRSAQMLLDRGGLAVVQQVNVQHQHTITDKRQREEDRETLLAFAKANGLDPKTLLGNSDLSIIDAEFTEVEPLGEFDVPADV